MKDYPLASLIERILAAKTQGDAEAIAGDVGDDYSALIWRVLRRLTWKRTLSQNSLLHMWIGEIAKHEGDTADGTKGRLHREIGLPIRLRNTQFAWVWGQTGAGLPYEKQCALLASGCLNVSSGMTTKELREYLDAIEVKYRAQGVALTNPEET